MSTQTATLTTRLLASGPGWFMADVSCAAGPGDPPFEERHETVSLAAVLGGTFRYRTAQGSALLVPGAVLLGNPGQCFECSHEHGTGDRCVSVHFTPDYWEGLVAATPGARKSTFESPRLPPLPELMASVAALETAALEATAGSEEAWGAGAPALEELALQFAGAALGAAGGFSARARPNARDERRVIEALRQIEQTAHDLEATGLSLSELSRAATMTPFQFLRTFRRLAGMTPHQYVLRVRLHRAAVRLRGSAAAISRIAYESGFNDLSSFNHRFRRLMGMTPGAYRKGAPVLRKGA
jgi:AraC-like DNA-binding protein